MPSTRKTACGFFVGGSDESALVPVWSPPPSPGLFLFSAGAEGPVVLSSLEEVLPRDGTPALIVFFSVSCPSCFDDLLEMIHFVKKNGLPVRSSASAGTRMLTSRAFMEKYSVGCSVVRDNRGKAPQTIRRGPRALQDRPAAATAVLYRDDDYLEFSERRRRAGQCLIDLAGR